MTEARPIYVRTVPPTPSRGRTSPLFFPLLFLLLVGCSDVFLINQRVAIHNAAGQNILGIRDVALLLLIAYGMPSPKKMGALLRLGGIKVCLGVVGLAVAGAVYALFAGRSPFQVANDLAGLIPWVLPFIVAGNLRVPVSIDKCHRMLVAFGVVVSVLSLAEVVLKVPLVTERTSVEMLSGADGVTPRSTPPCWPLMLIAEGSLLVGLSTRSSKSAIHVLTRAGVLSVVTLAILMTQARTLLVGMAVCLLGAMFTAQTKRARVLLLSAGLAVPLLIATAADIGAAIVGPSFASYYTERYAVLSGVGAATEYANQDGRTVELKAGLDRWSEWLWIGKGLAPSYREVLYVGETEGNAQMAHNILLYFGTRFGLIGIALFLLFCRSVLSLLYRAIHSPRPHNTVALCLGVDLASLVVSGLFSNVFAMPYMAPAAMVAFGCLVAWAVWSSPIRAMRTIRAEATISLMGSGAQSQSFLLPSERRRATAHLPLQG